jgi:ABC-2 type transport system permease protein
MQLLAVSKNAFLESIRQPIFPVLLLLGSLLLILNPPLCAYTFDDDNKLLFDIGLSIILMLGLMLSAFTATGVVSQEIENKTVLTVVSKPISRWVFIVGKFLGVATAITAAAYIWSMIFLFTARHGVMSTASHRFDLPVILLGTLAGIVSISVATFGNYAYRKPFGGTLTLWLVGSLSVAMVLLLFVGKTWNITSPLTTLRGEMGQVVMALVLLVQALWLICAIATAMSTRFGQVPTLIACLVIVFAGMSSSYFLAEASQTSLLASIVYRALPNMQYFWMSDALTQGHSASTSYYLNVTMYVACFILASLGVAVALFETRETS